MSDLCDRNPVECCYSTAMSILFQQKAVINGSTIIFCSVTSYITVNTTEFHSEFGQAAKYYGGISKNKKKSFCVS